MFLTKLPRKTRIVNITATGTGFALIQVSSHYNLNVTGAWPLFTLDPQVDKNSNANHLQLSICSGFVATREANESNMAVMEVSLPSGFTVDMDSLPSLEVSQNVKRVETKNGDTMVVLYFDKVCFNAKNLSTFSEKKNYYLYTKMFVLFADDQTRVLSHGLRVQNSQGGAAETRSSFHLRLL